VLHTFRVLDLPSDMDPCKTTARIEDEYKPLTDLLVRPKMSQTRKENIYESQS
jgi:hypothetical protein